ncbi:MAG: ATP-binding protein [Dehalococcoidia bacterium]|nr:ATP-binding protein [Dehalococcoidia bacterium]
MDTSSSGEPAGAGNECPLCKGARFVHPLLPEGKPDYSRMVPCRCAKLETETKRLSRLQKYSNLGALTRMTFSNLIPEGRNKETVVREQFHRAYDAALEFARKPAGWLVITGPSGFGKTHIAAAIANRCLEQDIPAFFITTADLLDHLRSSFNPSSELPYDELFEQVRNAAVLVIDDFGIHSSSPWAKEKLDQLLNHRFTARLPTVIVSGVPVEELEERVRTRLADTEFCHSFSLGARQSELYLYGWAPGFELQKKMTFESFDWRRVNLPLEQRQNLEAAYNLARNFAEAPDGWLVFAGVNGCGKTHLASAIVNYRYKQGKIALFIVVPDFLDHLRSTFSPDSKVSYDRYFESVRNTEILVLDDFGEQASTPWAQEKLYQVINHRYNGCLATVITTSCSLEELDPRIASRLGDHKISTLFHINVPDYRVDRPAQRKSAGIHRKLP